MVKLRQNTLNQGTHDTADDTAIRLSSNQQFVDGPPTSHCRTYITHLMRWSTIVHAQHAISAKGDPNIAFISGKYNERMWKTFFSKKGRRALFSKEKGKQRLEKKPRMNSVTITTTVFSIRTFSFLCLQFTS